MFLYNLIAGTYSFFRCFGSHDFKERTVFLIDPNGPEKFTGLPKGSEMQPMSFIGTTLDRGRYDTFKYCRRCGLRSDGKGYEH